MLGVPRVTTGDFERGKQSRDRLAAVAVSVVVALDGGQTWSPPVLVDPQAGTESLAEWWIDGDISTDRAGNLYATWDTQSATSDIGWLAYSTDGGRRWSDAVRVTPDQGDSEQLVEVTGARPGTAYVAWQTPAAPAGYATYIRPFSIRRGWLTSAPTQVSTHYGDPTIWPGDTFGIATVDGHGDGRIGPPAVLSWGSAINGSPNSQIYSSVVSLSPQQSRRVVPSATPAPLRPHAPMSQWPFRARGRTH